MKVSGLLELERESYGEAEPALKHWPSSPAWYTRRVLLNYDISWLSSISSLIIEISSSSTYGGRKREIKRERFKEICTMKLLNCILAENQGIFFWDQGLKDQLL